MAEAVRSIDGQSAGDNPDEELLFFPVDAEEAVGELQRRQTDESRNPDEGETPRQLRHRQGDNRVDQLAVLSSGLKAMV